MRADVVGIVVDTQSLHCSRRRTLSIEPVPTIKTRTRCAVRGTRGNAGSVKRRTSDKRGRGTGSIGPRHDALVLVGGKFGRGSGEARDFVPVFRGKRSLRRQP